MKRLTLILSLLLVAYTTFGQTAAGAGDDPLASVGPQEPTTIVLVPFDSRTKGPDREGMEMPNDDTIAVQTLVQQVWSHLSEKLPPMQPPIFAGFIRVEGAGDQWVVQFQKDKANLLIDAIGKELASAAKLSPAERKVKIADLAKEAMQVKRELTVLDSLTQHQAVSRETMNEKMKSLELERERINMELYAKQARRKALAAQMDEMKTALSDKIQQDEVLEQLNKIVEARVAEVKRMQELQKSNAATNSEVQATEAKVAEAKVRVAERKDLLRQSNGSDVIARLSADMSTVMVDVAELEARKHYIDTQLPNIATITEDQLKGLLQTSQYAAPSSVPPPLRDELLKKHDDLLHQWGVLLVKEVRLRDESAPSSQPKVTPSH